MARILVTGLNPAWQKILEFEALAPGQVNRALALHEFGSGKGLNAALVLRRLGHEVSLLQIVGGINGRRHEQYCREVGVTPLCVQVAAETRVCSTLVDRASGQATELIEPFAVLPEERVVERLLDLVGPPAQRGQPPDALLMSGTAPAGVDLGVYLRIAQKAAARLVVLDVIREVTADLLAAVDFIKINAAEYRQLESRGLACCEPSVKTPVFFITDGPRPARMIRRLDASVQVKSFRLPSLTDLVNPIGAGDTVAGYLTHALLAGQTPENAFREALAAGSASCLKLHPGDYDEAVREKIAEGIVVKPR